MFKPPPTFAELCAALHALQDIERPDSDNEGDPIDADSVFDYLSPEDQDKVIAVKELALAYTRSPGGDPNRRGLTALTKRGFPSHLDQDQHDPYRLRGTINTPAWPLDISDPRDGNEKDDD